jgi:NAD(P)-dependent dehydrogenase (short-subunit alcohol dehydrogenase family)
LAAVMPSLARRTALVSGGAGGIGVAIGRRFGVEGMKVVLADVVVDQLDARVAEWPAKGLEVHGVVTHVSEHPVHSSQAAGGTK